MINNTQLLPVRTCNFCQKKLPDNFAKSKKYCNEECGKQSRHNRAINNKSWNSKRFMVLARDGFICVYCGRSKKIHGISLEIDHILPLSKGGTDDIENLATACYDCNAGKRNLVLPPVIEEGISRK